MYNFVPGEATTCFPDPVSRPRFARLQRQAQGMNNNVALAQGTTLQMINDRLSSHKFAMPRYRPLAPRAVGYCGRTFVGSSLLPSWGTVCGSFSPSTRERSNTFGPDSSSHDAPQVNVGPCPLVIVFLRRRPTSCGGPDLRDHSLGHVWHAGCFEGEEYRSFCSFPPRFHADLQHTTLRPQPITPQKWLVNLTSVISRHLNI